MRRSKLTSSTPEGDRKVTDPSEPDAWVAKIEPEGSRYRIWLEGGLMISGHWWARTEERARRKAARELARKRDDLARAKAQRAAQITIR